jgi:hypothetical protein
VRARRLSIRGACRSPLWVAGGSELGVARIVAAGVPCPWVSLFSVPLGILLLGMFLGVLGAPSLPPKSIPAVQRLSLGIQRGRHCNVAVQLEPHAPSHCTVVWLVVAPCAHPECRCSCCCRKEWDQRGSQFHR